MLTRDNLQDFKAALGDAARTLDEDDPRLRSRYVELRPGMLKQLHSTNNHLLAGRRGVGKSTTLAVFKQRAEAAGDRVIFVDVESHKDRSYPDVLIELIIEILERVLPRRRDIKQFKLRHEILKVRTVLRALRDSAPEVTESGETEAGRERTANVALTGGAAKKFGSLTGSFSRGRRSSSRSSKKWEQTRRKEDYLRDLAPKLSSVLRDAAKAQGAGALYLVLDDFYFIPRAFQPLVLDHLHGITKKSNVWLKIGSVGSRTQSYFDGDPPRGMQPRQDLQSLSLDVGLQEFQTCKDFLERVTDKVLERLGLTVAKTVTETARERAVLIAGGGVARDYFDLLVTAADVAWEKFPKKHDPRETFRIGSENVQSAAGQSLEQKLKDLEADAGRDAPALSAQLRDITNFARDRDTYFVLVRQSDLQTEWGERFSELTDLRCMHLIATVRPNTGAYRGVDCAVFMLDISALVRQRMNKKPIEFWKPRKLDELRQARWVYEPGWTPAPPKPRNVVNGAKVQATSDEAGQSALDLGGLGEP